MFDIVIKDIIEILLYIAFVLILCLCYRIGLAVIIQNIIY